MKTTIPESRCCIRAHWSFIDTLIRETNAQVIAPAYRRLPFATWRESFDFIGPLYRDYCAAHPEQKIILMGDSAGGGLSVALTEHFKAERIRLPDELVLLSPCYPLFPIPEAKPAFAIVARVVKR